MELLTQIAGYWDQVMFITLGTLFILTIVVFFHELGHFLVARWAGVTVQVFSVGFGREIFGFHDRKGTRWRFCWIPLGGYVKFMDDENAAGAPDRDVIAKMSAAERVGSFHAKPLLHRTAIVAAGPIANFLLAIVIFAFMFTVIGQRITAPRVDAIVPGSAAEAAGFQVNDIVLSIDGTKIESFSDMQRIVSLNADQPLNFVVDRGGKKIEIVATPRRTDTTDRFGNKMRIGLLGISQNTAGEAIAMKRHDPVTAIGLAFKETYFIISNTLIYLRDVITGKQSADQLGGPIRIAKLSGQVASLGIVPLLNFAAVLSVSIGLLNLFPIPILDGGHLLFYAIEAIRGRPLSDRMQEIGFRIGLAVVLMLMILATWNDLGLNKLL